jgi:hypothetical protein|tara:strand:+ start:4117 stop:4686 length:570 start_codon:yes stop_codon:yes gene_type:complete
VTQLVLRLPSHGRDGSRGGAVAGAILDVSVIAYSAPPFLQRHFVQTDAVAVVSRVAPVAQHQMRVVPSLAARTARHFIQLQLRQAFAVVVGVFVNLVAFFYVNWFLGVGVAFRSRPAVRRGFCLWHVVVCSTRRIITCSDISVSCPVTPFLRVNHAEPLFAQRASRFYVRPSRDARHAEKMRAAIKAAA